MIAEEESDNALATLRELARQFGIYIHIGSLAIRISHDRAANRSFLVDPKGDIAARYDKIHMFDVDLAGGESYSGSRNYRPRRLGGAGRIFRGDDLGLTICYDLRFPALYRASGRSRRRPCCRSSPAFTKQTGDAHWHVLVRARAIENGLLCFPQRRRAANTRTAAIHTAIH